MERRSGVFWLPPASGLTKRVDSLVTLVGKKSVRLLFGELQLKCDEDALVTAEEAARNRSTQFNYYERLLKQIHRIFSERAHAQDLDFRTLCGHLDLEIAKYEQIVHEQEESSSKMHLKNQYSGRNEDYGPRIPNFQKDYQSCFSYSARNMQLSKQMEQMKNKISQIHFPASSPIKSKSALRSEIYQQLALIQRLKHKIWREKERHANFGASIKTKIPQDSIFRKHESVSAAHDAIQRNIRTINSKIASAEQEQKEIESEKCAFVTLLAASKESLDEVRSYVAEARESAEEKGKVKENLVTIMKMVVQIRNQKKTISAEIQQRKMEHSESKNEIEHLYAEIQDLKRSKQRQIRKLESLDRKIAQYREEEEKWFAEETRLKSKVEYLVDLNKKTRKRIKTIERELYEKAKVFEEVKKQYESQSERKTVCDDDKHVPFVSCLEGLERLLKEKKVLIEKMRGGVREKEKSLILEANAENDGKTEAAVGNEVDWNVYRRMLDFAMRVKMEGRRWECARHESSVDLLVKLWMKQLEEVERDSESDI